MSTRLALTLALSVATVVAAACDSNNRGVSVGGPGAPGGGGVAPARPGVPADAGTGAGQGSGPAMGGAGPGTGGTPPGSGGPDAGSGGGAVTPTACRVNPAQCTDGKDNDGDGKLDADDPECSGACDNDEGSFATGIPGDNKDDERSCHQDCFFDGDSGQGNDGCRYDLRCDPARKNAAICPYTPNRQSLMCEPSQACISRCRQVTPNGCDCFGCCAIPGRDFAVRLAPSCNAASFDDPTKCPRCTPVTTCANPCDKCETCIGKPAPDPSCAPAPPPPAPPGGMGGAGGSGGSGGGAPPPPPPPPPACPTGFMTCGPNGQVPANGCPTGTWCTTGCCIPSVID